MGECESKLEHNYFTCLKCNESIVEADNFCLTVGCRSCPMCDFCSTNYKHNPNSQMKCFNWLLSEFIETMDRDIRKFDNNKLQEVSQRIKQLITVWKDQALISLQKKLEWLDNVRKEIKEYLTIPKSKNVSTRLSGVFSKIPSEMLSKKSFIESPEGYIPKEEGSTKYSKKTSTKKMAMLSSGKLPSIDKKRKKSKKYEFDGLYVEEKDK